MNEELVGRLRPGYDPLSARRYDEWLELRLSVRIDVFAVGLRPAGARA